MELVLRKRNPRLAAPLVLAQMSVEIGLPAAGHRQPGVGGIDMVKDNGSYAEQFREQGYLVVEGLVSAEEVQQVRQRTEDLISGAVPGFPAADIELEPGARTVELATVRKLNRPAANDPVFLAHAGNPRVLAIVESIIGPDIKLYNSQCFMKPPGGVEKPYHQDSAYFAIEPMDLVTCWTALDDVTLEKGPMWVIPGSHRQGVLDHSQPWVVRDRRDKQVPLESTDRSRETPLLMPAGGCSFHHSLLLHRSTPNRSDQLAARPGHPLHVVPVPLDRQEQTPANLCAPAGEGIPRLRIADSKPWRSVCTGSVPPWRWHEFAKA